MLAELLQEYGCHEIAHHSRARIGERFNNTSFAWAMLIVIWYHTCIHLNRTDT